MGVSPVSFSYFSLSSPSCFFLVFFFFLQKIKHYLSPRSNWHILRDHACLFAGPMIIFYILHTLEQFRGYFSFPLYSFILVSPAPPPHTPSLKYSGYHSCITVPFSGGWCSLWQYLGQALTELENRSVRQSVNIFRFQKRSHKNKKVHPNLPFCR